MSGQSQSARHQKSTAKNDFQNVTPTIEVIRPSKAPEFFKVNTPTTLDDLCGIEDANLSIFETFLGKRDITVSRTSSGILVDSPDPKKVEAALTVLKQLVEISYRQDIKPNTIRDALRAVIDLPDKNIANLRIEPKTVKQREYLEALMESNMVFGTGPAGTGKTWLAIQVAAYMLDKKLVDRIILCRPAVPGGGEELGFLPGTAKEKVDPYMQPLYDALLDAYAGKEPLLSKMMEVSTKTQPPTPARISVEPMAFLRGRTLDRAFIIIDEAQNTTTEQIRMALTRIGEQSRVVVTGDLTQSDLPMVRGKKPNSGLKTAIEIAPDIENAMIIQFSEEDSIRSELCRQWVKGFAKWDAKDLAPGDTLTIGQPQNPRLAISSADALKP